MLLGLGVVLALLTACDDQSAQPSGASVSSTCQDGAREKAADIDPRGLGRTEAFLRFGETLETHGAIFGVPWPVQYSDFLAGAYELITGVSPYTNPEAGKVYRTALALCPTPTPSNDYLDYFAEPDPHFEPIINCVARALHDIEQEYGAGTVGYSETFRQFADDSTPREESVNYPSAEATYVAVTGRSPLLDELATQAFYDKARGCPTPP
jgi:hypothetical protein